MRAWGAHDGHASARQVQPTEDLDTPAVVGDLGAGLDSRLTEFEKEGFWGAVLVVRDNRVVLLKAYGLADHERGIRNGPSTRFEMNSIAKLFTGAAVLQLAAAKKIDVKDPVEKHLGAFPEEKRSATIEQLASHTSGLVAAGTELASDTREAFLAAVKRAPREAVPERITGTRMPAFRCWPRSSSASAASATKSTSVVTSFRLPECKRRFFVMRCHGTIPASRTVTSDRRPGSSRGRQIPTSGTRGAGGVWSTVGDIYRWVAAVENGRIVSGEQRKLLFAPHTPPATEAYGWHISADQAKRPLISKGGGSDDFASQLLYYPQDRVVVVWASNNLQKRWRQTLNAAIPEIVFR